MKTTPRGSGEIIRWALVPRSNEPSVIIIVVDDSDDDALTAAVAREDRVPSERFGGMWGSGQKEGNKLVAFQLIQFGRGVERRWYTESIGRQLLETILDVPHYVSIMPAEIAGNAITVEAMLPRISGSMLVGVEHRSAQVAEILAGWRD